MLSRIDLSREMMTVNQIIAGINLIDSLNRTMNPQLCFQVHGTHWVLEMTQEIMKFAEEDIYLALFDTFFNAGFQLVQQYDQELHSSKGMGETVYRESFLFQRVRPLPVFNTM